MPFASAIPFATPEYTAPALGAADSGPVVQGAAAPTTILQRTSSGRADGIMQGAATPATQRLAGFTTSNAELQGVATPVRPLLADVTTSAAELQGQATPGVVGIQFGAANTQEATIQGTAAPVPTVLGAGTSDAFLAGAAQPAIPVEASNTTSLLVLQGQATALPQVPGAAVSDPEVQGAATPTVLSIRSGGRRGGMLGRRLGRF